MRIRNNFRKIIGMIVLVMVGILFSMNAFAAKDFIVENKTSALFIINGTTGNIILTPSFGLVGIGTINPINALTVIGSVSTFGSLNATFINATEIRIGNNLIGTSGAFNNGNYTALEDAGFRIVNFTTQLNNYIPSFFNNENFTNLKPFTLTNYSAEYASTGFKNANYTSLEDAAFRIANFTTNYEAQAYFKIANYTALENAAFTNANYSNLNNSLWNLSRNLILYPKDAAFLVRIGDVNRNISNDTFAVIGSAAVYGSLNSTSFNSSFILQNGNQVQTINAVFNNVNYTSLENAAFTNTNYTSLEAAAFTKINYSAEYSSSGFKNANYTALEDAAFRIANFTTNYENQAYFKIVNYTALENAAFTNANYTNLNTSLWNLSRNLFVYLKDANYLVRIGDVNRNISNDTFAVIGSAAVYGSLNATSFNSSFILQNNNQVQTINAVFNNVNYTALENAAFTNTNYTNLEAAAFTKVNYSAEYASTGFKNANYTSLEDAAFRIANFTTNYEAQAYFKIANYSALNTTQWNSSGNNIFNKNFAGNVGIGTTSPSSKLEVVGNLSVNGSILFKGQNDSLFQPVYGTDDDLVLYLPFNSPDGSVQFDRSPYGNDGVQTNSPSCNATLGKYGAGCEFNGVSNYIAVGSGASLNITKEMTIEAWIKLKQGQGLQGDTNFHIVDSETFQASGFIFRVDGGTLKLYLRTNQAGTSSSFLGNTALAGGIWYHVVVVKDNNNTATFYINGFSDASANMNNSVGFTIPVTISRGSQAFNGTIDEVRIYKRALAPEEIRTQYLRGKGFGASSAITADRFRVVNTSASKIFEINQTVFSITNASGNDGLLYVDRLNNTVSIGMPNPRLLMPAASAGLHVKGGNRGEIWVESGSSDNVGIFLANGANTDRWGWGTNGGSFQVFKSTGAHPYGGTNPLTITNSSNVGIGTATAAERLTVSGNLSVTTGALLATSSGNVGIGTTVPGTKLTVAGDANISGSLNVSGGGILVKSTTSDGIIAIDGSESSQLEFNRNGGLLWRLQRLTSTDDLYLRSGGGTREVMFWNNANGNVGINTTNPQYTLQVGSGATGKSVNLSNVLFVNGSSGNVGIGTTGPNTKFVVSNAGAGGIEFGPTGGTNGAALMQVYNRGTSAYINMDYYAARHGFFIGGTEKVTIDTTGNVGIGTTTPGSTLTVQGTFNASGSSTGPGLYVNSTGGVGIGTTNPGDVLDVRSGNNAGISIWNTNNAAGAQAILSFYNIAYGLASTVAGIKEATGDSYGALAFSTREQIASGLLERMRIASNGKVGIGTTVPGQKLTVVGDVNVSGSLNVSSGLNVISGNVGIGTTGPGEKLTILPGASTVALGIKPSQVQTAFPTYSTADVGFINYYWGENFAGENNYIRYLDIGGKGSPDNTYGASAIRFLANTKVSGTNPVEIMRVDGYTGNVGIGTTVPSALLNIEKSQAALTSVKINNSNTNDGAQAGVDVWAGQARAVFTVHGSGYATTPNLAVLGTPGTHNLSFWTSDTERIRVDSGGNVGIGTTSPASTLTIVGNFSATGTKSAVVNTSYGMRKLYAIESPDIRFYDQGRAKLKNGIANISLDPIFIETVEPDYQVFLSPDARTKGIYTAEKAKEYFIVKSFNPNSNIQFSWLVSALRKGYRDSRMDSERKEENEITAVIDEENKITNIEINKNLNENNNALGKNANSETNEITGKVTDEITKSNNGKTENKFSVTASTENEIISQIKEVTKLDESEIKKYLKFKYKEPESGGAEEDFAEPIPSQKLTKISEVNGSVIIRLG